MPGQGVDGRDEIGGQQRPAEPPPVIPQYLENDEMTTAARSYCQAQVPTDGGGDASTIPW